MAGGKLKFAQIKMEVKRNLLKLQGGKPKFSQITENKICYQGLKPKKFFITNRKSKNNILQGKNRK